MQANGVPVRPMKSLLAFIAFVGLVGFAIWQHTTISSLNERVTSLTQELKALRASRAAPARAPLLRQKLFVRSAMESETWLISPLAKVRYTARPSLALFVWALGTGCLRFSPGIRFVPTARGWQLFFSRSRQVIAFRMTIVGDAAQPDWLGILNKRIAASAECCSNGVSGRFPESRAFGF